jgi:hypothetical protein
MGKKKEEIIFKEKIKFVYFIVQRKKLVLMKMKIWKKKEQQLVQQQ